MRREYLALSTSAPCTALTDNVSWINGWLSQDFESITNHGRTLTFSHTLHTHTNTETWSTQKTGHLVCYPSYTVFVETIVLDWNGLHMVQWQLLTKTFAQETFAHQILVSKCRMSKYLSEQLSRNRRIDLKSGYSIPWFVFLHYWELHKKGCLQCVKRFRNMQ